MHKLKKLVFSSEGLKQSLISVVGNVAATGISAVALILISRILGPSAFGQFSVGFAVVMIMIRINDLGLNSALQKFIPATTNVDQRNRILQFTVLIKTIMVITTTSIGVLISPWLAELLNFSQTNILILAFIATGVIVAYEHMVALMQSLHLFTQAVAMNAIQATTKLIGIILFMFLGLGGVLNIFSWYTTAPLIAVLAGFWLVPSWIKWWPRGSFTSEYRLLKTMAQHSAIGFIAAGMIEHIDVLFVQRYLSDYETGLLSGLNRISMMLLLVAYSLGNVLYPRVARYQDKYHLQTYLKKAFLLVGLCVVGFFLTIPLTKMMIVLTIGPEYLAGWHLLVIMIAAAYITIAAIPFQALFYSFKAEWYFSVSGIFQLLIVISGNLNWVPIYGLEAAVWTRLTSRVFLLLFSSIVGIWWYYRHYVRKN